MILLTHGYFLEEDPKEKKIMRPYVPLGILYISAYLEKNKIAHQVLDTTFISFDTFTKQLLTIKPEVIGIYTNLMTKMNVLKIIRFIRQNHQLQTCKIILGGPEIRYNAENYLKNGAHLLVVGEGEQTFLEICQHVISHSALPEAIDGIAFLNNNEVVFTQERALIKNIDILPMPARDKIDLKLYGNAWKKFHGYSMYSISTMRGCPYTCKWCSRAVYGGTYRRRSAKLVVDEMELLKTVYQPDQIWFVDDVFTINHKWLREFKNEVVNRGIKIPYEIITRADRMNDEVIQLLKESGCFRVWIGAESGSQAVIDAMDRRVDVQQVREMIIKTKAQGMEAGTFIMLGYPGETKADIAETIKHLQISNPTFYTITLAYPIAGTPLYEEVKEEMIQPDAWKNISDREYKIKRKYSDKFYQSALAWVNHEVNFHKAQNPILKLKLKAKSIVQQIKMLTN